MPRDPLPGLARWLATSAGSRRAPVRDLDRSLLSYSALTGIVGTVRHSSGLAGAWRWRMFSILYIIGAIVVIIVVLKLLGLY